MSIYTPYFYIIQHTPSGLYYAGSKFGKGANPDEFMTMNGYKTSSRKINNLIRVTGLQSFNIMKILTADEVSQLTVYDFETLFLREINAAADPRWLNCHNNKIAAFGTKEFEEMMFKIHGTTHSTKIPGVIDKIKTTNLERYGASCVLNIPENIESRIKKCIEKYGSANNREEIKKTNFETYGVESLFQRGPIRENIDAKIIAAYGGMGNASQIIAEKQKQTLTERYGVENSFQIPTVIEKTRQATIDRNKDNSYRKTQGEKISNALKFVDRKGENNSFYGKQHSDETKAKLSAANKGRTQVRYCCIKCSKEISINNKTNHEKNCH